MQKINFNFDKRTVVFSMLFIIVVVEIFVLLPWSIKRIASLGKKTAALKEQIKTTEGDWPRLGQYTEASHKLREEIVSYRGRFINPEEVSKALSFISENSKEFSIEIQSFLPGEPLIYPSSSGKKLFYLPIEIKAKGQFHNLALFLSFLQNSQYFFELKQLKITSDYPYNSLQMLLCGIIEKE